MAKISKKESKIIPLGDRVLVRPFTEDELKAHRQGGASKSSSGIIIPDSVSKEKSAQGKVLEVGPGRVEDGKRVPLEVKKGDIVIFSKYSYDEVESEGEELYLIKEDHILAVIK